MADETSIRIRGVAEIQRALFQFNSRLAERVTRLAMRKGANYMLKEVRAAAPKKTGRLKKTIKVKNSRINTVRKNGKVGVYITVNPGKSRRDTKGAWYGKFVETGYQRGNTTVAGKHFVVATFNATAPTALAIMVNASEVAMRHLARELNLRITG